MDIHIQVTSTHIQGRPASIRGYISEVQLIRGKFKSLGQRCPPRDHICISYAIKNYTAI